MQAPGDNATAPAVLALAESGRWGWVAITLKTAYLLAATALSVWVVSFAPAGGPPIHPFIPANASVVVFVADGANLLQTISGNRAVQDLLNDPDVNTLYEPKTRRDQALEKLRQAPAIVRWLFPPTLAGLSPLIGQDCALAGAFTQPQADGDTKERRGAPTLFITRLSGSRGQLVRMALAFAPLPRNVRCFDLGGGLVAVGVNGAAPANPSLALPAPPPANAPSPDCVLLARLLVRPSQTLVPRSEGLAECPQYEQLQNEGVPDTVLRTLLRPPDAFEMLNLRAPSLEIATGLYATANGGLALHGTWNGPVPLPQAAVAGQQSREDLFAEGLLPIDIRQCFHKYLESEMRLRKGGTALTRGQRRWSRRLSDMDGAGVDLDRDLLSACGHAVRFSIEDDPLDPGGYGLVLAAIPFGGASAAARNALAELVRARWSGYMFEGPPPPGTKPPYVKRVPGDECDRYLLNTGQFTVPAWTVSRRALALMSNVGPHAWRNPSLVPAPREPERAALPPDCYFLRLDGPRLAPTVERLATLQFDNLEEEMGAKDFLAQYPDATLQIRLLRKVATLAGQLRLELRPQPDGRTATIEGQWVPGSLAAAQSAGEESVPPPAPPPKTNQ